MEVEHPAQLETGLPAPNTMTTAQTVNVSDTAATTSNPIDEVTAFLSMASHSTRDGDEHGGSSAKPILLPYRQSPAADSALQATIDLFAAMPIRVHVLHIREWQLTRAGPVDRETKNEAWRCTDKAIAQLQCHGIRATGGVQYARPHTVADHIVTAAHELAANIIVLGTRRRRPLLTLLVGSTTYSVLRRANCPVLLAHPQQRRHSSQDPSPDQQRKRYLRRRTS